MATPAENVRNIDFEALRSLRDRHGAVYPKGRVIFRRGDTSPEFYVVLQGSVELSITSPESGAKSVLLVAPPGDFFGEMSCFSGAPRSATAIANEDNTVLLQFNQDTAIQLLRASPRFALGVIQRLTDRVTIANSKIEELASQLAAGASARTAAGAARAASPARDLTAPTFDRQLFVARTMTCPVGGTRFAALSVRPDAVEVKVRESDFHELYGGPSPLWYLVFVCPECLFAAYPDDFATLPSGELAAIRGQTRAREQLASGRRLVGERQIEDASAAFRLAVDCYTLRAPNYQRLGGIYHRLAWLCRERGDTANEMRYLAEALQLYLTGLSQARPTDPTVELTSLYTIGELQLRLGNPVEAVKWLQQVSQHPAFRQQPDVQRLTRDRWAEARAQVQRARA
jgi:CRP-like cAMP-binding protein